MFGDSDMHVSYLALLNVTRCLRFVALSLMRAVAQWFYDLQPEENPEERECIGGTLQREKDNLRRTHAHYCDCVIFRYVRLVFSMDKCHHICYSVPHACT